MYQVTKVDKSGIIRTTLHFENKEKLNNAMGDYIGSILLDTQRYFLEDDGHYELLEITKDNVNNPSHYTQGKIECIDALESATIGKKGIEAVCVANVVKYLWRYEEKNGIEDVKKAEYYLKKLIDSMGKSN